MNNGTHWPADDIEILRGMWAAGKSASQIARALGRYTRSAVIGKVHRLDLPKRKTTSSLQKPPARRSNIQASRPAIAASRTTKSKPDGTKVANADAEGVRLLRSKAWEPLPDTKPVALIDCTGCRWPIDGPDGALFCNGEQVKGGSYCHMHAALSVPVLRVAAE